MKDLELKPASNAIELRGVKLTEILGPGIPSHTCDACKRAVVQDNDVQRSYVVLAHDRLLHRKGKKEVGKPDIFVCAACYLSTEVEYRRKHFFKTKYVQIGK